MQTQWQSQSSTGLKVSQPDPGSFEFSVVYQPLAEGGWEASVPALPEVFAHGDTLEEAREMAEEMLGFVLETMQATNDPIPADLPPVVERISVRPR
ncbi:MAG: type II toxin-antitoxin system HicB family antitoxin [Acidobacteriaceae bacterium]|nr:type II toxin-antitoxin system HicB family antitoxin [Acidobacteriaceae bacterium]